MLLFTKDQRDPEDQSSPKASNHVYRMMARAANDNPAPIPVWIKAIGFWSVFIGLFLAWLFIR
jgi:hypothetical protein